MRKLVIPTIAIIALNLISCKKEYKCACTTTWVYDNGPGYSTEIISDEGKVYDKKMTQKNAKIACDGERQSIETSFINLITGNGSYPLTAGESVKTNCTLGQ